MTHLLDIFEPVPGHVAGRVVGFGRRRAYRGAPSGEAGALGRARDLAGAVGHVFHGRKQVDEQHFTIRLAGSAGEPVDVPHPQVCFHFPYTGGTGFRLDEGFAVVVHETRTA